MKLMMLFPSWMTNGLFSEIMQDWTPWANEPGIDKNALDIEYFGNRSGEKEISPLLKKMVMTSQGNILSDVLKQRLDKILRNLFEESWKRVWLAMTIEYNPIENYNGEEITEHTGSDRNNMSTTKTNTGTQKTENNTDLTQEVDTKSKNSSETTDLVKGFNSSDFVDLTKQNGSSESLMADNKTTSNTTAEAENNYSNRIDDLTETNGGYNETVYGSSTKTTRHGNLGVTQTVQMIESEKQLRAKPFFDTVFADLDRVLTIGYWRI